MKDRLIEKLLIMATSSNIKPGTGKILTEQDIEILQKSSFRSEEEIRTTHAEFWEEFPDGRMTKEGFIKYYQLIFNDDQQAGKNCDDAFSVFDQNQDGVIDFPEFLFMSACDNDSDFVKQYSGIFHMRNTSGTGQIDKNELIAFLESVWKKSGAKPESDDKDPATVAREIFYMLGSEENGTLNKEQVILGCKKYAILAQLFADKDEEES